MNNFDYHFQFLTRNYTVSSEFPPSEVWFWSSKVSYVAFGSFTVTISIAENCYYEKFRHGWFGMCTPFCILFKYKYKPTRLTFFYFNYLGYG